MSDDLRRLGLLFQQAVREVQPHLGPGWAMFPAGACWDASQVFASWLREKGYGVTVWSTEAPHNGGFSHVWCEVDGWHVDVTHGQLDQHVPLLISREPPDAVRELSLKVVMPLEDYADPGPDIRRDQMLIRGCIVEREGV